MSNWRTEWTYEKVNIARHLAAGRCGGTYGEAVIVLSAAISAFGAEVWPGRGKDRLRFVEVIREFAPTNLGVTRVSTPLLVGYLHDEGRNAEGAKLRKAFLDYCPSRVVTGADVDKWKKDISSLCPGIESRIIREHSYANLLYGELRCSYAHQYQPGSRASSRPMTSIRTEPVSYVNRVGERDRQIHFNVEWLGDVTISLAEAIDNSQQALPRNDPTQWWIQG